MKVWIPVEDDRYEWENSVGDKDIYLRVAENGQRLEQWDDDDTDRKEIYFGSSGLRLCQSARIDIPKPDWSLAPDWSNWWAVDPNGYVCWYQEEPILCQTVTYCGWVAKTMYGIQIGNMLWDLEIDIPLGIDWRLLKEERPK